MTTLNNYYNEIRTEIGKEFGLEVLGYGVKDTRIPVRIAQRINAKYPSEMGTSRFTTTLNPKAVLIAKRYRSLVMGVK
jgi:hypothetical protein